MFNNWYKINYVQILSGLFIFHKFQEKNLILNRDSNSDLQISSLALYRWYILVLFPIHLQTLLLKCLPLSTRLCVWSMTLPVICWSLSELTSLWNKYDALNQIISENKPYNLSHYSFTLLNFKRKIWTWTGIRTRTSIPLAWRSIMEQSWFLFQFTIYL